MIAFDKLKIRESLTTENIFDLLYEFGGEPNASAFGLISATICHNPPGEGSKKLYYYENTGLFKCFTGCDEYFDPFQLVIKVAKIQWGKDFDLNDAVRWVAQRFGFSGEYADAPDEKLEDWIEMMSFMTPYKLWLAIKDCVNENKDPSKDIGLTLKEGKKIIVEMY